MNKRKTGQEQEQRAAEFLEGLGYRVIRRNYRCRAGEIDLIAEHKGCLVFIEVKYRKQNFAGYAEEAVDLRKQRQISKVAAWYLAEQELNMDTPCRFDVAAVTPEEIRVYEDAFFYTR
ncbi:MAG: YraN family protein [Clostridiales bacterium]|nr:YraN family protein [Clostridiales bacterium]